MAALRFDRDKARGMRLDIAAGTAVRFEPGQERDVTLVPLGGKREVYGFQQKIMGKLDDARPVCSAGRLDGAAHTSARCRSSRRRATTLSDSARLAASAGRDASASEAVSRPAAKAWSGAAAVRQRQPSLLLGDQGQRAVSCPCWRQ